MDSPSVRQEITMLLKLFYQQFRRMHLVITSFWLFANVRKFCVTHCLLGILVHLECLKSQILFLWTILYAFESYHRPLLSWSLVRLHQKIISIIHCFPFLYQNICQVWLGRQRTKQITQNYQLQKTCTTKTSKIVPGISVSQYTMAYYRKSEKYARN